MRLRIKVAKLPGEDEVVFEFGGGAEGYAEVVTEVVGGESGTFGDVRGHGRGSPPDLRLQATPLMRGEGLAGAIDSQR